MAAKRGMGTEKSAVGSAKSVELLNASIRKVFIGNP